MSLTATQLNKKTEPRDTYKYTQMRCRGSVILLEGYFLSQQ